MFNFNLYNTPGFKKILSEVYDIREINLFDNDVLNSLCPFFISNKWIKNKTIFNMPFNFYYTPKFFEKNQEDFFKGLYDYSHKNNVNIIVKSLSEYRNCRTVSTGHNSVLSLKYESYDEYFASLSKKFRQNIRTTYNRLDANFKFQKIDNLTDLKQAYYVMSVLYVDKHKMVFQPYMLFELLFKQGIADFYIYKDLRTNSVLSCIVVCKGRSIYHYNWGFTLPEFNKYSLNTLLVNELIKKSFIKKISYIDFGTTPNSDVNLKFFKNRWGCFHHPVYFYYTQRKPSVVDLNSSFFWARNIYSKLPKPFIRSLMPKIIPWLVS